MSVHCPNCGAANASHGTDDIITCFSCGRKFSEAEVSDLPTQMIGNNNPTMMGAGTEEDYVPFSGTQKKPQSRASEVETLMGSATSDPTVGPNATSNPTAMPVSPQDTVADGDSRTVRVTSQSGHPSPADGDSRTVAAIPTSENIPTSPTATMTATRAPQLSTDELIGMKLGGFVVKKLLGKGGMGAVYLARQVSLDRDIALKVLPAQFAGDPDFLSRFIREALSAAHMNHHNVVQVFDVGHDKGVHFIAMEFVPGTDLGAVIRKDGKLRVEDAAGYVLQAARGLHFAHQRGFIHRDIKPDNLMVNEQGIVKIADMGLAKKMTDWERTIGMDNQDDFGKMQDMALANHTALNVAMGTPAYMAPEQGQDASKVDHRADQYSLGCTLYYLCAGKAPFTGKTTFEIISKHMREPVIPLEQHVKNVPKELSYIIQKMLAKNIEDRYRSMAEVVDALEAYLGVDSGAGAYTPREHHVAVLEREIKEFYAHPLLKVQKLGFVALAVFCSLVFVAGFMQGGYYGFLAAGGALGLLLLTPTFLIIASGIFGRNYLFRRMKNTLFGMSWKGYFYALVGAVILGLGLYISALWEAWLVFSIIALGLALAWQFGVLAVIKKKQQPQLQSTQDMLRELRLRGVSEEQIQDFIARFSGERWEEFFESLFGYEDMIKMREKWASRETMTKRKRTATWRDPLVRWFDDIDERRRELKDRKSLTGAEKARLTATGMSDSQAEAQASKLAEEAVDGMATIKLSTEIREQVAQTSKEHVKKKRKGVAIMFPFRMARLALGAFMIASALAPFGAAAGVNVPQFVVDLIKTYLPLVQMFPLNYFVLTAGVLLFITVFSGRFFLPFISLLGGLIMLAAGQIGALAGVATLWIFYGGSATVLLSVGAMIFAKSMGKKF